MNGDDAPAAAYEYRFEEGSVIATRGLDRCRRRHPAAPTHVTQHEDNSVTHLTFDSPCGFKPERQDDHGSGSDDHGTAGQSAHACPTPLNCRLVQLTSTRASSRQQ